jgi:hypothetical protein
MATDNSEKKLKNLRPFKAGEAWSGNAAGRPKGSRNKLSEEFLAALNQDFTLHGPAVIEAVRKTRPADYLKIVAAIVPKDFNIKEGKVEDLSDAELMDIIADVRALATSSKRPMKNRCPSAVVRRPG